ncbi:MAG: ATP-binding protein, partial [Chloroflexi bacterium]|nr:ATP-binding protein [Chloroflexota bacterium]
MDGRSGERKASATPRWPIRSAGTSPFVGRDDELRRLVALLALAAEGRGSTVFLTGQPGIGKTRLAREALAVAKRRDFVVLEGRAFPVEAGLAYAIIVDAF